MILLTSSSLNSLSDISRSTHTDSITHTHTSTHMHAHYALHSFKKLVHDILLQQGSDRHGHVVSGRKRLNLEKTLPPTKRWR